MEPLAVGSPAPPIPGGDFSAGPTAVFFYKVTCPVCQMASPQVQRFEEAYSGRIVGVGQEPREALDDFEQEFGMTFSSLPDVAPYDVSNAYGIRTVPTTFLIGSDSTVLGVVESWDREGLNGLSRSLAELTGAPYTPISESADGLPPFRPG